jgi:hypothetical protein
LPKVNLICDHSLGFYLCAWIFKGLARGKSIVRARGKKFCASNPDVELNVTGQIR